MVERSFVEEIKRLFRGVRTATLRVQHEAAFAEKTDKQLQAL